jgi:tetratricopeptide (TPR) repeat protein
MKMLKTTIACTLFLLVSTGGIKAQSGQRADEYMRLAEESNKNLKRDDAISYYEKASVEFHALGHTEQFINSFNQIGLILTRQDKYERAKTYLDKALSTGLSTLGPNHLVVATTYLALGVVYAAEDNFVQSLEAHNKALQIRLLKLGKYDAQVATSYGNIGNVYFRKREYDRAIENHLIAKQIREKVFGKNSVQMVDSYRGLGNAYREKKSYKKSLDFFEKALRNRTIQLGHSHLMGNKLKAEEYKRKAEEIAKQSK